MASRTMNDVALYPYLLAMREEVYNAQRAEERLQEARTRWLTALDDPEEDIFAAVEAEQDILGAVELLLTGHARLSLFLFPARDRAPARGRGKSLRRRLGTADDHSIGDREARNGWMHVDEQVDRAVFERAEDVVQSYQLVRSNWPTAKKAPSGLLLLLNVDTLALRVAGTNYDLKAAIRQIDEVGVMLMRVIPDVEHQLFPPEDE